MTSTFDQLSERRYNKPDLLFDIIFDGEYVSGQSGNAIIGRISERFHDLGDPYRYEPLVISATGFDEYYPHEHKWKPRGQVRVEILNEKITAQDNAEARISDLLADYGFIGAEVIIRQFFEGCTWADVEGEIIFQGSISNYSYDATKLTLTISPHKDNCKLPPYRIHKGQFIDSNEGSRGKVMPIIVGELINYDIGGGGLDMDAVGGALSLTRDIRYESGFPRSTLLVACHECFSVGYYWDQNYATQAGINFNNGKGPGTSGYDWMQICYITSGVYDCQVGDTCDVQGLKDWNEATLLTCPTRQIGKILHSFAGKNSEHFYQFYKDSDYQGNGIFDNQITIPQLLSRYMKNFPMLPMYHDRRGRYTCKELDYFPSTEYPRHLSKDHDIKIKKIEFSAEASNSVALLYWKNLANRHNNRRGQPDLFGPWFQKTWITCIPQDIRKVLTADMSVGTTLSIWITPTGGIDPEPFDLMMIDNEIMEVKTYSVGNVHVWDRGGCGTTARPHALGAPVYILRTHSCNGICYPDQHGGSYRSDDDALCVAEQIGNIEEISISPLATDIISNPDRLGSEIQAKLNASVILAGTYSVSWDPERNRFTFIETTGSYPFKVFADGNGLSGKASDYLATVIGWLSDSPTYATTQRASAPAQQREFQAAYAYARYRIGGETTIEADLIRGVGFAHDEECPDAIASRNYHFDMNWRKKAQITFESNLRCLDLTNAMIFEFDPDLDEYTKIGGRSWEDIQWRVIKIRRPKAHRLEFIAEEVLSV